MKKIARKIRSFFRLLRQKLIYGIVCQGKLKAIPQNIIIEPTNICNLKCSVCPQGDLRISGRKKGMMSRETFQQIMKNMDVPLREICFYLHGEPFLNKDLEYFVSETDKIKKLLTVIYSNGYEINIELLDKVLKYKKIRFSFSMDIIDKQHYEQIRPPAIYEKAINSLKQINEVFAKNNRKFELSIINANSHDRQNLQEIAQKLFGDYTQLRKVSFGTKFPWPEHFYTGNLDGNIAKSRRFCKQINGGVSVFWNGDVSICSYDYSGKLVIGNLAKTTLSEIYNSEEAKKIRKIHFLQKLKQLPVCAKCLIPRFTSQNILFNYPDNNKNEKTRRHKTRN
jgi:radical SAM protein with 4Fe4S-binding SPASM domain